MAYDYKLSFQLAEDCPKEQKSEVQMDSYAWVTLRQHLKIEAQTYVQSEMTQ